MFTLIFLLSFLSFDRVEEGYAVLIDENGDSIEIAEEMLPQEAKPGDLLESPTGPVVTGRAQRWAALKERRARLEMGEAPLPSWSLAEWVENADSKAQKAHAMAGRTQDHFARKAKEEGYHARSIYKLEEIDQKVKLIHPGDKVLDLGCSPGSWMQYTVKAVGPKGHVVGIDLKPIKPISATNKTVLQGDIFQTPAEELQAPVGQPFDEVLSDMAPNTCGDRFTDHVRSVELCRRAFSVAEEVLRPGGSFVCKVFEGGELEDFVTELKGHFDSIRRLKPKGTRSESVEIFLIAKGFKGKDTVLASQETNP